MYKQRKEKVQKVHLIDIIDDSSLLMSYKIDVVAIQKVRWINNGILHKKNFDIYYSCDKKEHALRHGFHGRKLMQRILDWKLINQRICVIYIIKANFKILVLSMPMH